MIMFLIFVAMEYLVRLVITVFVNGGFILPGAQLFKLKWISQTNG